MLVYIQYYNTKIPKRSVKGRPWPYHLCHRKITIQKASGSEGCGSRSCKKEFIYTIFPEVKWRSTRLQTGDTRISGC